MNEENTTPEVTPEVTEAPAPAAPGSAEYNAQMAAEGQVAMGNVPAKFVQADGSVNMEAFAKSYLELENKLSTDAASPVEVGDKPKPADPVEDEAKSDEGKVEPEAPVEELRVPDPVEEPTEEETVEAAATIGVTEEDLSGMTADIMRTGDISAEQRADLINRGVADAVINAMVDGQRARMRDQYTKAADIVGGSDRLSKIFGWAAATLSPEQRTQINAGLSSDASELTLRGLASMYDTSQGEAAPAPKVTRAAEPSEITRQVLGNNSGSRASVQGFATKAEMYAAMDEVRANPGLQQEYVARMAATPDPTSLR